MLHNNTYTILKNLVDHIFKKTLIRQKKCTKWSQKDPKVEFLEVFETSGYYFLLDLNYNEISY